MNRETRRSNSPIPTTSVRRSHHLNGINVATSKHLKNSVKQVKCAVLTVSDSRDVSTDESGAGIVKRLTDAGHELIDRRIVPDDLNHIDDFIRAWCQREDIHAVLITGGTGVTTRDTTYEAVTGLLDKQLDGFGELFRMLSFEQVGALAMLSRAVAGVHAGTAVFAMPGSTKAVVLAMDQLILPVLGHMTKLLAKA